MLSCTTSSSSSTLATYGDLSGPVRKYVASEGALWRRVCWLGSCLTFGLLDVSGWSCGAKLDALLGIVVEAIEEVVEVAADELPLKRLGDLFVAATERE